MLSETVGVGQEGKELFKCLWLLEKKRNFLLKRFRTLSSPTINDNASAQKIDSNCNAITDKISPHSIVPQSDNPIQKRPPFVLFQVIRTSPLSHVRQNPYKIYYTILKKFLIKKIKKILRNQITSVLRLFSFNYLKSPQIFIMCTIFLSIYSIKAISLFDN